MRTGQPEPAKLLASALDRGLAISVIGERDLADTRLAGTPGGIEHLSQLGPGLNGDHEIGVLARQRAGLLARDGDPDRQPLVWQIPEFGLLDIEMASSDDARLGVEQGGDDSEHQPEIADSRTCARAPGKAAGSSRHSLSLARAGYCGSGVVLLVIGDS